MNNPIKAKLRKFFYSNQFTAAHGYIQIITMFAWLILLSYTSAYYVIYLLVGLCGFFSRYICNQDKKEIFQKKERFNLVAAAVFSLFIIAANHDIYYSMIKPIIASVLTPATVQSFNHHSSMVIFLVFLFCFPFLFLGGTYVTYFILKYVTKKLAVLSWGLHKYDVSARKVFWYVFALIGFFHLLVMLLCFYPGALSGDSIVQIREVLSNQYTNLHPIYHTMIIRFFVMIGVKAFHDINLGVALYSVFSIMFLSAVFAYGVVTLYQLNINKKIIMAVTAVYLIFPQHIFFSFTVWKDVFFSASILLFTISMFRYIEKIGSRNHLNLLIVFVSSLAMCLFRGNGFIVFLITLIVFAIFYGKRYRKICISLACMLLAAYIVTFPVLSAMHIKQADFVELMSVPLQQVTRTLKNENDLSDEQLELLSKVADIDAVTQRYDPYLSDPVKFYIRDHGNQEYIQDHKLEFIALYLKLGITHPKSYINAWADQTKGFWNAGYDHKRFIFYCSDNEIGVKQTVASKGLQEIFHAWAKLFEYFELLKPFVSIGFHTWLILLVAFIGFRKKDKLTVLLTVPCLAIVFSLMIGTPSFAEFRYAYALFCCLPFLGIIAFRKKTSELSVLNLSSIESEEKQ